MTIKRPTAADLFLTSLKKCGVDYVFANAGTDFAPIVESLLDPKDRAAYPEFVICPHENLAVAMAQGYFLATGKAQAAMVHVNVGVANAMCGLLNAARDNIPILFASGRTPITEQGRVGSRDNFIHWGQEMFDQGAMLREFVKWDYELRYPEQTELVVTRAHAIANSEPKGPVYLSLPREVLAEETMKDATPTAPVSPAAAPAPDADSIAVAAQMMATARAPLIVTARAGRTEEGVAALSALAQDFAIPVVEFAANYMCLPFDHPMHAGYSPAPHIKDADLVIVVDAPIPWPPSKISPKPDCAVIQIGPDPLFQDLPVRGFRSDISISADAATALRALHDALVASPSIDRNEIKRRFEAGAARFLQEREKRLEKAARPGAAITHAYASHCISEALGEDGILVNERGCLRDAMKSKKPGTFFGPTIAGGLGASVGMALGIKTAKPGALVAATLGDGSLIFNNPVACLQTAAARELPILILVLNNAAWDSVRASTVSVYPDGLTAKSINPPLTSLAPSPDYAAVANACGADGVAVKDPAELPRILSEAVNKVQSGKNSVLVDIAISMG